MLKRVSIQNFKSLKDVTLDLQKVNLLIGPNNSGKTNFLKALEIVNDLGSNLDHFDESLLFKKSKYNDPSIYFIFDSSLPWDDDGECDHYRISSQSKNRFVSEKVILKAGEGSNQNINEFPLDFQEIAISEGGNIFLKNLQYRLENVRIYKINIFELTNSYPLIPGNELVSSDAKNIVAFLDNIRDKFPDIFSSIQNNLSRCVTEFSQIRFDNIEPSEIQKSIYGDKTFKKLGLYHRKQRTTYWADELSEGTLYFLALLCIINQPKPPQLLLLEEPEKGIHPRRIREVMDFIFRLAEEKDVQIILTSHNEHVLDDFATRPEAVFVFDKDEEGATYVRNLQTDIIEPTNRHNRELGLDEIDLTTNLSENWLYGLLGGVPSIP